MNRRQFLMGGSATVAAVSVGGCLGNVLGGGKEIFKKITTEGISLVVTFAENTDIQSAHLITSAGSQFAGTSLNPGEYKATINLISFSFGVSIEYAYTPGSYTLVAVDSEGNEYEQEITLHPNTSVSNIEFLKSNRKDFGEIVDYERYTAPVMTIDNTTDSSSDALVGPDIISGSGITGPNIPQPKTEATDYSNGIKPLVTTDDTSGFLILGANTSRRTITTYSPFAFPKDDGYGNTGYKSVAALRQRWSGKTVDARFTTTSPVSTTTDTNFTVKYTGNIQTHNFIGTSLFYFKNINVVNISTKTSDG